MTCLIKTVTVTLYSREAIICATSNKCIGDDTKAVAHQSPNCIKNKKISEKRFSICRMEFLHAAMWHDRDIDFARWLHPAMWHVTLESWHGIRQVAALCSVAGGSGMTCHWIRLNVRHIGILHLVSISTTSPQSASPFLHFGVKIKDGGSPPSWILGVPWWVLWKAQVRLPIGSQ